MSTVEIASRTALGIAAAFCCALVFWFSGGLHWLEKDVFPPRRPSFMPVNSVWIDAPPLPMSWHHGWWFGCGRSSSEAANYCRLVGEGSTIFAGEYLSCRTRAPILEKDLILKSPQDSSDMWLFTEHSEGVAGFTRDGDILLPLNVLSKCDGVAARLKGHY